MPYARAMRQSTSAQNSTQAAMAATKGQLMRRMGYFGSMLMRPR